MFKKQFNDIMKLEIDTTNKLLEYMHSNVDFEKILSDFNLDIAYIQNEKNTLALNLWLSLDYIGEDGMTIVNKFLSEESDYLTDTEKDILNVKSKSHVSLYEILDFDDNLVILRDILLNKEYRVLEPNIHNVIKSGEYLFTRIGNVMDNTIFMGDINYVPSPVKEIFLENLLIDYNMIRKNHANLTIDEYLKDYSLNLYNIYDESLIYNLGMDGDMDDDVFDELDDFEMYLYHKHRNIDTRKHMSNLSNFFEYALFDGGMSLYDIDKIDLNLFFEEAIGDGFINTKEELNSYISTLKNYLHFLTLTNPNYKPSYSNILNISKNRFKYMKELDVDNSFKFDKDLLPIIEFSLNDNAIDLVMDYDKFLLFLSDTNLKLTPAKKQLKRKDLLEINGLLENYIKPNKKTPNQDDFILIDFFYNFSLKMNLIEIHEDNIIFTKKGLSLLRLEEEEKYYLLFSYLWSRDFIEHTHKHSKDFIIDTSWKSYRDTLYNLDHNMAYYYDEDNFSLGTFATFYNYFKLFGLMEKHDDSYIKFTYLGAVIFDYLVKSKDNTKKSKVIKLEDFKKSKLNMEG